MKIYTTQAEVERDIKNKVLAIKGDVKFECSISIDASIIVTNGNINALNINALNIDAMDIIVYGDVKAGDINAGDIIVSGDIKALDIEALDIKAENIKARDISYYAFCCVYGSIICTSIQSRRKAQHEPVCLDGMIVIKPKEDYVIDQSIEILEKAGYQIIKN